MPINLPASRLLPGVLVAMALASPVAAETPVTAVDPEIGQGSQVLALSGNLIARRTAVLSPQVAGLVAAIRIDAGDRVAIGDELLRLDQDLAKLEVRRAEAVVEEARRALLEARRLRDEGRRLVESRFVPDTEVQAREAAVLQAEAAVSRVQSELEIAREQLAQHVVAAPFDGVITTRMVEVGEWVATGTAVAELVAPDELWLDVRVPQAYWTRIDADTRLRAFADPAPDTALDARIHARVPVKDPAARTFLLRLRVDDDSGRITPGMSARVELQLPGAGRVTTVPRDAILRYPDGTATVWVVDTRAEPLVAREQEVQLLRTLGERVELAGAFDPGLRVVIRGNEALKEGETVRLVEP
ncbi:efflux RND transporter periplasmic adaptor subunit [Wenzhouxiangella sp. XN24]|uniref:efflux RND transporter periplasmic adaptor subunit n=1 Tax=Wenzhouxiangella sp. XN24 TaxID=2713569 RepID=UPI0013EC3289|nr:efflux RND transporter periplasmic adaptor subunit [Wenzhouxiangella sp. XN24]NGX15861.1 efflux RND transporter periplasmic adaptor subunit [Wenzhouxiangella sp. XN24]